ncbi:15755_t:CDS:2, partial [Cetraspora pellucida]
HVKEYKREIGNENGRPIYEAVKGSSKKVKEILTDFTALLKQETELELGKSFTTLLPEQQNLLKISGESNNSARNLTENKRKIKAANPINNQQDTENGEWEMLKSEQETARTEAERLTQNFERREREEQEKLRQEAEQINQAKNSAAEEEEKRLTSLITNAKAAEEQELARAETQKQAEKMRQDKADKAINKLKNHWKKDNFRSLTTEKIDIELNNLKRLIDNEKLTEREITITDYDTLRIKCFKRPHKRTKLWQFATGKKTSFSGRTSKKSTRTNWEHKEQIRKKKEFFINKIRAEEAKQFLEKALEIAELEMSELEGNDFVAELRQIENSEQKIINFRISTFKEIVERGINRALKNENPHVPYNKLTGDPKSSILQVNSEQDKLNAFTETLSQIKTKRQKVAEDLLQELINEETPNNHSELQNHLNNLQQLIPHNNNVANRAAERKNSDNTDIKLSTEISENLKKLRIISRSKDKPEEIKALSVLGNLPENINWEKRTQNRINELKAEIANEIESLREYLLTSDKQKSPLESKRNKRYEDLEKINKSIKKMNETEVWKELKELYQHTTNEINNFIKTSEGREKLSKKNFVVYTSLNPQNLFNQAINKIQESIRNCSSAEEIDNQLGPAIKELEKDLNNKIYGLKPATDHQTGVKSEQIADNDILPYLRTGLTAERAANAYSFFNPQQRILVKEIINKQAIFAGRTYDLQTDNGLKKAQAAKLFLHDFHNQKGTKFEINDKRILNYQEVGVTGKQAFNAYQQG